MNVRRILLVVLLAQPVAATYRRRRRRREHTVCDDVPERVTEDSTQCVPVTLERTVWRNVTKFKKGFRTVAKYVPAKRLVNRTQTVEFFLPIESFLTAAKMQIIKETQEHTQALHFSAVFVSISEAQVES